MVDTIRHLILLDLVLTNFAIQILTIVPVITITEIGLLFFRYLRLKELPLITFSGTELAFLVSNAAHH